MMHIRGSIFAVLVGLLAAPAAAYVGPGPGLTMLGSLVGLVGSLLLALLMILAWPIRLYYKKMKAAKSQQSHDGTPPPPAAAYVA